ncbi:hypothetical protein TSAR_004938 [Trichomalopsis sarcophagae]|uniref:Uncharacterized protein n=1 Tax=Trichomalopsis sarcophagae TaxID=543379 RepID=A0A232ETX0_9HYME|nr:hypothetical protein TSAR_004938 [Trichomalopsis sarcophagae]
MKYAMFLILLALVVCTMSLPAVHKVYLTYIDLIDHKRFIWNLEACEKVAAKARSESTVCADYVCKEYSFGLAVAGVNCTNDGVA